MNRKMPKNDLEKNASKNDYKLNQNNYEKKNPEATNYSYLTQKYKPPQNQCLYYDWF
jgi:hypothetical protein